ncbi:ESPR domain-containing protein, partial [Burkholderia sp. E168m23]|uniref:ESPR domain-containing protein n=1 Tax=Burkholderia sp. E168m23 TaxID=1561200 RepID=UPI001915DC2F
MNKSYKVVWNVSSGTWTAVPETAKSRASGASSKDVLRKTPVVLAAAIGVGMAAGAGHAHASNTEAGQYCES